MPTSDIHNKYREVKENFENYFNTFVSLLHHDHPKSLQLAEQHFQNVSVHFFTYSFISTLGFTKIFALTGYLARIFFII